MNETMQATLSFAVFQPLAPIEWRVRPATLRPPGDGTVHLWKASLDHDEESISWRMCLSSDERERADRFRNPLHRDRFIRARSIVRHVLADYLQSDAGGLRFHYGPHGKPALADGSGDSLQFNLSHSGGLMLLGVCDRAIGLDVEEVNEFPDLMSVARRAFSPQIVEKILALAPMDRTQMFFEYWTLHEARLKAVGLGLATRTDGFESEEETHASVWSIRSFETAGKFAAACAFQRQRENRRI